MLLSVLGIALGVALGYAVHLVNRAAVSDLAAAVRALAGEADLEVRGGRSGFSESLYPRIARLAGVSVASPVLELDVGVAGSGRTIRVVGLDILRAALVQPQLAGGERFDLLSPDTVMLSAAAADALGLGKDDKLQLIVGQRRVALRVAGILPGSAVQGIAAVTDIATAQWRLGRLGELNRIDIRLSQGKNQEEMRKAIQAHLPPGVHVSAIEALEEASATPSRSYRVNLNVLAMIALFTGGFLVFSAQALEAARRRAEHALLRVIGLTRRQLARLVLTEAAALGGFGAALGLALGYAVAQLAVRRVGADLGAGMFRGQQPQLSFQAVPALFYFAAGVAIAVLGALLPALDAARTPPARALKAGDEQELFRRASPAWPGLALLAAGALLSFLPPVRGLPLFGYAAVGCLLLGTIALMPRVADAAFRAVPSFSSPWLALALAQLRGAPGQAAVSLAAIVASFSLMAAMAIMVSSFRHSVDDWLDRVLPADLYFRTTHLGDTSYLEPGMEGWVRGLPQVARVDFLRGGRILLDPGRPPVGLIARDNAAKAFPLIGRQHALRADDPLPVWVSEAVVDLYAFRTGTLIQLPLNGKSFSFVVAGVFRDYARQHGALLIDRADYIGLTGDRRVNDGALWLAPGVEPAAAMAALRALPGGAGLDIAGPGEIRRISLSFFDRTFAVTYAMEAVAVLVGLFGLSSSLGAVVLARRREFGMLRHLGMTRRQIAAMLAAEGGLLAALGALAGLVAGVAISLVLVFVINRQSFNWGMEMHFPLFLLFSLMAILILLSVITAMLSGREAMSMAPVRAVREDW
ncbi:MAG: putative transport system permease protein [Betaproteobacteria bacterium]|jgi:putative ABC transport system permease protein|nr:putative transport system permease protein [Betaproteobacteria bacterium]